MSSCSEEEATRERGAPTTTDPESQPVNYAPTGSICEVHNLYESKPDKRGRTTWTKEYPDDLTVPAEDTESGQYALLVRNVKCYDGRKPLQIHSIVVQSKLLKEFLAKVFKNYPGLTMTLKRVEFKPPFMPFVHRWEEFSKAREEVKDPKTKSVVDLLYNILEGELCETITRRKDLILNGVVTHDLLWTIFEPGVHVYCIYGDHERVFQSVSASTNCEGVFVVSAKYVDYDGSGFGYRKKSQCIPPFQGTMPITALPVFPLHFHPNVGTVRDNLISRGRLWEEHSGYHYKQYEGPGFTKFMGQDMQLNVKSRVIIDGEAFNTFNPDDSTRVDGCMKTLNDEQRLLATPTLRGYSLKDKKWLELYLEGVRDIVWDSRAFDSLVLPAEQQRLKGLILAIAKAQSKQMDTFDDVVQGKGRGVIIQLSGPPGVGKTLTAESVAEVMRVPLYVLSAGDLGTSAGNVERALKDILRMVPKWGAVLLLDEADVFMETRNSTDLERNELVSIFLRLLEYYEGILFLTTNRAESIDPAFESRIHVSVRYPDLDTKSRRQIWAQFLGENGGFSSEQLNDLAQVKLNGRQIKNILKTAHLLAREQDHDLGYDHIRTVLDLRVPKNANLRDEMD
ncbi:P-loop containing nucleoside triphosphate hydrolase protein [Aspergillus pseudotamarii]|uniref:P-loop containing nucleoside triphosphate hydrolase protein n=1 Tax=Aspergillus pseudotamarii TaxID=132259 RepID=A0A5N6T1V4_ASPPS|nr:P-loop containing nucleoside triphosphate hydrolase protein [Aspergillus pseudotamarii]KAE8140275.1 P-loop containing nucleoside triphosphate hydrolase protein [Aspergillus pseudotamarii]